MINSKIVKLADGAEITVTEVKVKCVLALLPLFSGGQDEQAEVSFSGHLQELLEEATGLRIEQLQELRSSEIEKLWEAFAETNGFFFRTIKRFGLEESVGAILCTLLTAYGEMFASLLSGVTLDASTMDLAGLPGPGSTRSGSEGST